MLKLDGRVALITGSSQGMGAGIVRRLHAEGARVVLHGLEEAAGRRIADELNAAGPDAIFHPGNLADAATPAALVAAAVERFGALDIVVNSAGDTSRGTLEATSTELWDRIFAVNVRAPFLVVQAALPWLRRSRHAAVVNIGSVNAYIGEPKLMAYSASKGALLTLTKNLASALARDRIRVNMINPGWTLTEQEDRVKREIEGKPDWQREAVAGRPFGRLLVPDDIARAVLFLCSGDSDTITGAVLDYEQYPVGAPPNW
jgi:NAD(P)-dependent dehydrogenase (short-subunit alcohol dehydrogenase family)